MYKGGYSGKILRVNLTDQSVKTGDLPDKLARLFIGLKDDCPIPL
jgi:aldehyde:ferredoxin oxidoreductase